MHTAIKNLSPDPLKKQTIFLQSTQTDYGHDAPIEHPSFTYPEIDYLLIIASPSHEGHVPFKRIKKYIPYKCLFFNTCFGPYVKKLSCFQEKRWVYRKTATSSER